MVDAVHRNTRSADLTEPVNIKAVDLQNLLDLVPHLHSPRFCSAYCRLDFHLFNDTCFLHGFCKMHRIGRCTGKRRGAKIFHTHQLTFRISG